MVNLWAKDNLTGQYSTTFFWVLSKCMAYIKCCVYINKERFLKTDGIGMSDVTAKAFIAEDGVFIISW